MLKRPFWFVALLCGLLGLLAACQAAPTGESPAAARTMVVYRPAT
jgi:hypothetical protein